ncbi:MAG: CBU_0592 family membrane protein [Methylococcaceae bacterium]|jgi:hypothetical protein
MSREFWALLLADPQQLLSLVAAFVVLAAYLANLFNWLDSDHGLYAFLNAAGSGVMTYVALESSPVGIILMEGLWTGFSLVALLRALLRRWRSG